MGRTLVRSSRAYVRGVLSNMGMDTETPFTDISGHVAQDADEIEPVRRVLAVMVKQKHAVQTGEGDTATYKLTESGNALLNALGGA